MDRLYGSQAVKAALRAAKYVGRDFDDVGREEGPDAIRAALGRARQPKKTRLVRDEALGNYYEEEIPDEAPKPKPPAYLSGTSAATLMTMEFPPLKQVVPGFLVEGLNVLAGAPKQGKSWLCLDCADAVADGGLAFGSVRCEQGDVLYLALEDGRPRLQRRLRQRGQTRAAKEAARIWVRPAGIGAAPASGAMRARVSQSASIEAANASSSARRMAPASATWRGP